MASTHIFRLRRGTRYVDENGATRLDENGVPIRDDWTTYTAQEDHFDPLGGELVVEYEVYPDGKKIPRLKIGDGESSFADLEYISVDSFILPKTASVYLDPTRWEKASDDRYYQVVKPQNAVITSNSKVDLTPSADQLDVFHEKDLAFVAENENGVVSVFCVGRVPTNAYTIPITVTEVIANG